MKAFFDGQDYILILDKAIQELEKLHQHNIKAPLKQYCGSENLDKLVRLGLNENDEIDGIEVTFLPKGFNGWESIERIEVNINNKAYEHIKTKGKFGTRYNGSDKIEILY
jgi:hypothetical protein